MSSEAERAENPGFLGGRVMEVGDDEAVVAVEGGDEVGEIVRGNAAAELAVEFVGGLRGKRIVVDGLDGGADVVGQKEIALPVAEEILEHLVAAVACTTGRAELTSLGDRPLLLDDLHGAGDELVVVFAAGLCGGIWSALRLAEDADEGFGDGFPLRIDPEQGVVILRGADVAENAGRSLGWVFGVRVVLFCGEDDIGDFLDGIA